MVYSTGLKKQIDRIYDFTDRQDSSIMKQVITSNVWQSLGTFFRGIVSNIERQSGPLPNAWTVPVTLAATAGAMRSQIANLFSKS